MRAMQTRHDRNSGEALHRVRPAKAFFHFEDVDGVGAMGCTNLRSQLLTQAWQAAVISVYAAGNPPLQPAESAECLDWREQRHVDAITGIASPFGQYRNPVPLGDKVFPYRRDIADDSVRCPRRRPMRRVKCYMHWCFLREFPSAVLAPALFSVDYKNSQGDFPGLLRPRRACLIMVRKTGPFRPGVLSTFGRDRNACTPFKRPGGIPVLRC